MRQNTLGVIITQRRKAQNLTQQELAEQMGVTAAAVSKWERDQSLPDIYTLSRLADLFGVTLDELLGRNTNEPVELPPAVRPRFSALIFFLWALAGAEALSLIILGIWRGVEVYWAMGMPNIVLKVGVALFAALMALFLLAKRDR